jgi:hypothetical protein
MTQKCDAFLFPTLKQNQIHSDESIDSAPQFSRINKVSRNKFGIKVSSCLEDASQITNSL